MLEADFYGRGRRPLGRAGSGKGGRRDPGCSLLPKAACQMNRRRCLRLQTIRGLLKPFSTSGHPLPRLKVPPVGVHPLEPGALQIRWHPVVPLDAARMSIRGAKRNRTERFDSGGSGFQLPGKPDDAGFMPEKAVPGPRQKSHMAAGLRRLQKQQWDCGGRRRRENRRRPGKDRSGR